MKTEHISESKINEHIFHNISTIFALFYDLQLKSSHRIIAQKVLHWLEATTNNGESITSNDELKKIETNVDYFIKQPLN